MDIREKVINLLEEINPQIVNDTEADLLKSGYIDSFEIVNLVMGLEDMFGVEIEPEEITPDNFKTIENIVGLVEKSRS